MASALTSKELFWQQALETTSKFEPGSAIVVQGKTLTDNSTNFQKQMFSSCNLADRLAEEFFSNPPKKILDLGAGMGANTLPMAASGAHVTAIDSSQELLTVFAKNSKGVCPVTNLTLIKGDITTMESYGGPFNLVVAVDILPYLPSAQLQSTIEKIHQSLEDRGIFIGTIFTTDKNPVAQELMEKLGSHFYKGENFVEQLLTYSGFTPLEIEEREEGGFRFKAQKLSSEKK